MKKNKFVEPAKIRIKKNDTVMVLAGRDKGKTGRVLSVYPKRNRILVEGVNFNKKHSRKTAKDQQGGIIHKEASLHASNVAIFCKGCSKPVKIGVSMLQDGSKSRFCKKCNEVF